MQKITPFLWFNHQTEEAMNFYISIFKDSKAGKIVRYGDSGRGWLKDKYGVSWQIVPTVLGELLHDKRPGKIQARDGSDAPDAKAGHPKIERRASAQINLRCRVELSILPFLIRYTSKEHVTRKKPAVMLLLK